MYVCMYAAKRTDGDRPADYYSHRGVPSAAGQVT